MESTGNHRTSQASQDAEEGFEVALLTADQLERWSHTKCFNEAFRHDDRTDKQIARAAGISQSQVSKLRAVLWEERARQIEAVMTTVRHAGFVQKLLWDLDLEVVRKKRPRAARRRPVNA
ncbi:hypothetical protein [Roseateles sp.]|uniref:hypothetical protein n=1 Tax=Roseateles sp. TaxID=1971397 RepID=UPI0031DF2B4F